MAGAIVIVCVVDWVGVVVVGDGVTAGMLDAGVLLGVVFELWWSL